MKLPNLNKHDINLNAIYPKNSGNNHSSYNLSFKEKLPPDVVENCNDIMAASENLLDIVENILNISKLESKKIKLVEEPYNFKELVKNDDDEDTLDESTDSQFKGLQVQILSSTETTSTETDNSRYLLPIAKKIDNV